MLFVIYSVIRGRDAMLASLRRIVVLRLGPSIALFGFNVPSLRFQVFLTGIPPLNGARGMFLNYPTKVDNKYILP